METFYLAPCFCRCSTMRWIMFTSSRLRCPVLFLFYLLSLLIHVSSGRLHHAEFPIPDEHRLVDFLFNGSTDIIAAEHVNRQVVVKIAIRLNQIVGLDERQQVMTTNLKIEQRWASSELQWRPQDFGGVSTLRVSAQRTWLPDTFIFNNADDRNSGFLQSTYVLIKSNGIIYWPSPVKLKTSCTVRISMFPFDAQNCSIQLGSWIHSVDSLRYAATVNESLDLTRYTHNSEWILLRAELRKEPRVSALNMYKEMQEDVVVRLYIRRRSFFYIWNIIVPCVMLSFLTLLLFWTPTQSGEKISLGLSIFLAYSMFMLLIAEQIPPTSEHVPLIGIYLTIVMSLTAASVIMAVLVVNLSSRAEIGRYRPPLWLRRMTKKLLGRQMTSKARTFIAGESNSLFSSSPNNNRLSVTGSRRSFREFEKRKSRRRSDRLALWIDIERRFRQLTQVEAASPEEGESCLSGHAPIAILPSSTCICASSGQENTGRQERSQLLRRRAWDDDSVRMARLKRDWYLVTLMVDRILFFLFLFLTVTAYIIIFSIPGDDIHNWGGDETPIVS